MSCDVRVPVFRQETDYECGNTSLKSVLWYFGRRPSARSLRELCHVRRDGVDHAALIRGACSLGATVFAKSGGTISDLEFFLRRSLPVIVGWWSRDLEAGDVHFREAWSLRERKQRDCGHYSVVCGVGARTVTLMDPQQTYRSGRWRVVGPMSMTRRTFLNLWYDTDTDRYVKVNHWLMVVNFSGETFSDRVRGGSDHAALR